MDRIVIHGRCRLKGEVKISGAKNAALPIMAASLLAEGESEIGRVPELADVKTMGKLLNNLGTGFHLEANRFFINTERIEGHTAPYDFVKTMRASVLVIGPLLARRGMAKVSLSGGCHESIPGWSQPVDRATVWAASRFPLTIPRLTTPYAFDKLSAQESLQKV